MTGTCCQCGALGPVELHHPDGRQGGRPLFPSVVEELCPSCHYAAGRIARTAGVEAGPATVRNLLTRRAAWAGLLAALGCPAAPGQLTDLAMVLETAARATPPGWPLRDPSPGVDS
ncbi:MAG: hypothetical protein ACYDB7_15890 [Mycobacteriales bacterium]